MTIKYPIAFSVGQLEFFGGTPSAIVEAEYTAVPRFSASWDDFVYQEVLTSGHPCRHEVSAGNPFVADEEYEWTARFKDGNGDWSCYATDPGDGTPWWFTQANLPGRHCLDCSKVVNNEDLGQSKFGEQETDTSAISLKVGTFSGGNSPVQIYRTTIDASSVPTEDLVGTFNLPHSIVTDGTISIDYKVQDGKIYILYVTNIEQTGSEVIFCYVNIAAPTVVADSMMVIWYPLNQQIHAEISLVPATAGFVAFVVSNSSGEHLESYRLSQGTWSGLAYPTTGQTWEWQNYRGLYNYSQIAFRSEPNTFIVYGVQNSGTDIATYRLDIEFGVSAKRLVPNALPATTGSNPVFVDFLPGESFFRVLASHYTPGVGAEVLSLVFRKNNLGLAYQQIIPYSNQIDGVFVTDPDPYICNLTSIGNGRVIMTRTVVATVALPVSGNQGNYMEVEVFQYNPETGELTEVDDCERTAIVFVPGAVTLVEVANLSLVANLDLSFYAGAKVLLPFVRDPSGGSYHLERDFVGGSILDFDQALSGTTHREYGTEIGTVSGSTLQSFGLKGDASNSTLQLNITADTTLAGLKVSATFDRADPAVWASSAWIYIQELDYSFPLVLGDETGSWPITVTDEGVSVGEKFGTVLSSGNTLTFELFQSSDFVPGSTDITYSSLSITAYEELETVDECTSTLLPIDLFTTALDYDPPSQFPCVIPQWGSSVALAEGESMMESRRGKLEGLCGHTEIVVSAGTAYFEDSSSGNNFRLLIESTVDVDLTVVEQVHVPVIDISDSTDIGSISLRFVDSSESGASYTFHSGGSITPPETFIVDISDLGGFISATEVRRIELRTVHDNFMGSDITFGPITTA